MAHLQINLDEQLLHHLFIGNEKDSAMDDRLETILNQVLNAQASEQINAEKYERGEKRTDDRNGSHPHQLKTRVGTLTLLLHSFLKTYQEKVPRIIEFVETAFGDVKAVLSLPEPYRRRYLRMDDHFDWKAKQPRAMKSGKVITIYSK